MRRKRRNKKSQVWVSDYTLSMLLFVLAVILSVKIVINSFSTNTVFDDLKMDASKMSEILLSEGYPVDWTNETVIRPGLLTAERLNESKVVEAMNMTYTRLKPTLQTRYEFLVIFEDSRQAMIEFDNLCVIGSPDVNINKTVAGPITDCHNPLFDPDDYDNLVKLTRLVVHESGSEAEIIKMVVYAWK
ncbi:hypothetical protein KY348_01445 [Candidatus Woesearchaeota archaeon]|nr:hypothetical protein [Candidatus Woesearchaeota archaeon]